MYSSSALRNGIAVVLAAWMVCALAGPLCARDLDTGDPVLVTNRDLQTNVMIRLTGDQGPVPVGEEIRIAVEADRDCYLALMHVSVTGRVTVLWPNAENGWDDKVVAGRAVRVTGEGTGIRIRPDGKHPEECFWAVAASKRDLLFRPGDFEEAAGGQLKVFSGDVYKLGRVLERRIHQLPPDVHWGTAKMIVTVTSSSTAAQSGPGPVRPSGDPFSLRSANGKYLSVRNGEIGFFATTVGPTEVFRFSPVANEQFKIIGHNGLVLARPETAGESVERRQAFDPWLVTGKALGVVGGALRGSHGKYVAIGQDGSRLVFDACFPSRTPHSALFLLERVSGQGAADEPSERAQWNLGPKVLDLPRGRSLFNE